MSTANSYGLKLCARYAYVPSSLGFCGPEGAGKRLLSYALGKKTGGVRPVLSRFEALHPYLKLIAEENGMRDEFESEVVEALWVGNRLLEAVETDAMRKMVSSQFRKHLPGKACLRLAKKIPDGCLPHHSFHVLYFGSVAGVIGKTIANQDMCRISWGKVAAKKGLLHVDSQKLAVESGRYALKPSGKKAAYAVEGETYLDAKKGDTVSMHWGLAVEKLDRTRVARLQKYTLQNMRLITPIFTASSRPPASASPGLR